MFTFDVKSTLRKLFKILRWLFISIIVLLITVWVLLQLPPVQTWLVHQVTHRLSKELHTTIEIDHVDFSLFNRMNLEGVYVQDKNKDTLLYADFMQVRITDWFFFKDNITLKYIGLKNATIKAQRTNTTWNYQFLIDYFSSSDTSTSASKTKLNLQEVHIENIQVIQHDAWKGKDMHIALGTLHLQADGIDTKNNQYHIHNIDLHHPSFTMYDYEGLRPEPNNTITEKNIKDSTTKAKTKSIQLLVDNIDITEGAVTIQKLNTDTKGKTYFDGNNVRFTKITGNLNNFKFLDDTISAKINLHTQERSGLQVKKLQADFTMHPHAMIFNKLMLNTNNSELHNYFAMRYQSIDDLDEFEEKVQLEGNFSQSTISSNDLALFTPELQNWKMNFYLAGHIKGILNNITGTNISLRTNNSSTSFAGNITLTGLPKASNLYIDANHIQLQTQYKDLIKIIPSLKKTSYPNIAALENLKYQGNFYGFLNDFTLYGSLQTSIGNAQTDINIKLKENTINKYDGKLGLRHFKLGKFLNDDALNIIDGDINLIGDGINKNANINLIMQLKQLDYKGYAYTNIFTNGKLNNNKYNGTVKVNDPNLQFQFDVNISLLKDSADFSIVGELQKSNFKTIGFTKDDVKIDGLFDFNFRGKNIDAFSGYIKMFNTNVFHEGTRLNLDSVVLKTNIEGINKTLILQSNEIDATIVGEYKIAELAIEFKKILHQYLPTYFDAPKYKIQKQNFSYSIHTGNIDGYLSLLDKNIQGFSNTQISGTVNTDSNKLTIDGNIPSFKYKQISAENLHINGNGNGEKLDLGIQINNTTVSDSLYFPSTAIDLTLDKNVANVKITTSANQSLGAATVEATVNIYEDGVAVHFKPSSFILNDKLWSIQKEGEIIYRNKNISANNILFSAGEEQLTLQTQLSETSNHSDLYVQLHNIALADFMPLIIQTPRIEGMVNGTVIISDPFGDMSAYTDTALNIDQFRFENNTIGNLNIKAEYFNRNGKLLYEIISPNTNYDFTTKGTVNLKDTSASLLNNNLTINALNLNLITPYLSDVFSDVKGTVYGQLQTNIIDKKPTFNGTLQLKNAQLTVAYTNVSYAIDTALIICKNQDINFTPFNLKDRFNNIGKAQGILTVQNKYNRMAYDFDVSSNRLELLNTTATTGQPFFGKVIGSTHFMFKGPQTNMKMSISAQPTDTSSVFIRNTNSRQSADADFIVWKQYGTEMQLNKKSTSNRLDIDLDIKANNLTNINVILDELTGDIIKATGSGSLRIHTGTLDPLTMRGRYDIDKGSYNFNFQSVIKKPFLFQEGSGNFIEWNGDPLDARINIETQYIAKDVRFSDLITSLSKSNTGSFSEEVRNYRGDVYVIAKLTGNLSKPIIDFKLIFPPGSPINNDVTATSFLQRVESDKNELLKQITYLIVFNSFAPYGEGGTNTSSASLVGTTLSSIIATQLNNAVANVLSKISGRNLSINLNTSFYSSAGLLSGNNTALNNFERSQVNLKIGKSFFNNNVLVTFGNNFDFRLANTSSTSTLGGFQYLPNLNVEFILSKDRRLRAIVFYTNTPDPTTPSGQRNRSGASLSYKRDFDRLFGNNSSKKLKDSVNKSTHN